MSTQRTPPRKDDVDLLHQDDGFQNVRVDGAEGSFSPAVSPGENFPHTFNEVNNSTYEMISGNCNANASNSSLEELNQLKRDLAEAHALLEEANRLRRVQPQFTSQTVPFVQPVFSAGQASIQPQSTIANAGPNIISTQAALQNMNITVGPQMPTQVSQVHVV